MARQRGPYLFTFAGQRGIPQVYVFLGGRPSLGLKSEPALLDDGFFVVDDLVAMVGFAEGDFVDGAGFFMVVDDLGA